MRIEDDVVITPTGIENLTTGARRHTVFPLSFLNGLSLAPRSIDAIEALMAHKLPGARFGR